MNRLCLAQCKSTLALIIIELPKKVVSLLMLWLWLWWMRLLLFVLMFFAVVLGLVVVVVVVIFVGPTNLTLRFGQNCFSNC